MSNTVLPQAANSDEQFDLGELLKTIPDDGVYVLNPFFRVRRENDFAVLCGAQGIGTWTMHLSYGVVFSLFNGKRTVLDIAKLTRHFADRDSGDALTKALVHVKSLVYKMTKTREEQAGKDKAPAHFLSDAPLLSYDEYRLKFPAEMLLKKYDPHLFLPHGSSGAPEGPFNVIHYSAPLSIAWHITSVCAANCRYCYLGRRDVQPLPLERMLDLIKEMFEIGVFSVDLLGGDVLCNPNFFLLLDEIANKGFLPVNISTKSFLSKDKAKRLSDYRSIVYETQFSIDTDDNEAAEFLLGEKDYCDRIFSSIENALDVGLRVAAKAVITPYNVLTVPRLYRKLKSLGVSTIRLAAYSRSGFHHTDDLFLNEQCYRWLESEVQSLQEEFPDDRINVQNGGPSLSASSREEREQRWSSRSACTAGRSCMMICADGKVIPCEQMPETEEYFCGDVSHQSIMDVWNGGRLKEMTYGMPREKFRGQPCYDCEEREECHHVMGYCIRDLAAHWGNIYQPPPNCPKHDLPFIRQT